MKLLVLLAFQVQFVQHLYVGALLMVVFFHSQDVTLFQGEHQNLFLLDSFFLRFSVDFKKSFVGFLVGVSLVCRCCVDKAYGRINDVWREIKEISGKLSQWCVGGEKDLWRYTRPEMTQK
jgi:hypothetical protein